MYRIHQIKLGINEDKANLTKKILKKLGRQDLVITWYSIVKESVDARDKKDIRLVYSVDFKVESIKKPGKSVKLPSSDKLKLEVAPDTKYIQAVAGENAVLLEERPIVVGMGPAGMFAALILAQAGYRPLILERGQDVDGRSEAVSRFWNEGILDTESNVQFGEGGAGTFSDGKLTTGIKDSRIRKVLEEFVSAGGPEDILYKQKPHIGTDVLRIAVKNMREEIIKLGGEVCFSNRVDDIILDEKGQSIRALKVFDNVSKKIKELPCRVVVFAPGHSARDTFRWFKDKNIKMAQKPFSIGVRIEHSQDMIDIARYGATASQLGLEVSDYKLNHRCENGRGVYTFCMCPGGRVVVASSQEGGVVTNGMSNRARNSGVANSALLCDVRTSDFPSEDVLAGVEFQEKYEKLAYINGGKNYKAPSSTWGELRDGKAPLVEGSLPAFAVDAFREAMPYLGKKLKGFDDESARVSAVESRSSSPVRIFRDNNFLGALTNMAENQSLQGFYPCGEGAGYAGGIVSAAVDGIKVAETIIRHYKPI